MFRYGLTRIAHGLFVMWGAFTLAFLLLRVLPGDAVLVRFQDPDLGLTPGQIAEIRAAYGADETIATQYGQALYHAVTGRFGQSLSAGVPVSSLLAHALPVTLRLTVSSLVVAGVFTSVLAYLSFLAGTGRPGRMLRVVPTAIGAFPVFWLSILVIQIVSFRLRLVSVINVSPWGQILLPALTLGLYLSSSLSRLLIGGVDATRALPFVTVLTARGMGRTRLWRRHLVPNSILPVVTQGGVLFGELLAGAVVTETVFGLNGLGRLAEQAVVNQDVAVLEAIILVIAALYVAVNLLVDMIFLWLDPRVRTAFLDRLS